MSGIRLRHESIFVVLMIFLGILAVALASEEPLCLETSKSCLKNEDCCNGCCFQGKCVAYSETCVREKNPCSSHVCPPNSVCYLQKVMCIQAPCPPIPACKPIDYDYR